MRRAGANMIQLFGERVERRQGKGVVLADQEASGAQGSNYTSFFLICASLYPVLCSPDHSRISGFNGKVLFLPLRQGTMGTGL